MSDAFASTSPDTRRSHGTSKGSMPPSDRYSMSSFDTGESSMQGSRLQGSSPDHEDNEHDAPASEYGVTSARGTHRSHRSRTSGGFLLSDSTFDAPVAERIPTSAHSTPRKRDSMKEKGTVSNPERSNHIRKKPSLGLGVATRSPLSKHVRNAEPSSNGGRGGDGAQDKKPSVQKGLDIESANIVNLALNLSESRKQVGRRIVTSPLPPAAPTFEGGLGGGSLAQHLQAQRRVSRNISPKPGQGAFGGITRQPTERIASPLNLSFDSDSDHKYHFSQATLERAQKTKDSIELMAQYRRLLQYLPPLKPTNVSRQATLSPPNTSAGSPTTANFKDGNIISGPARELGRPYNPLQYIRNRKVRARERQMLDGAAEGYADVEVVTAWVDRIEEESEHAGYELSDVIQLPPLIPSDPHNAAIVDTTSPDLVAVKPGLLAFKPRRPKNDWLINGPDMLADVVWLEQNDNKKLIEDNRERKIYPAKGPLIRQQSDDFPTLKNKDKEEDNGHKFAPLKLDTKLPTFKPLRKSGLARKSRSRSGSRKPRGRHKLLGSASKKDSGDSNVQKGHISDSGTSGSEKPMFAALRRKRPRAGTADSYQSTQSYDMGRDVLQKQMNELLKKESKAQKNGAPERPEVRRILSAMETHSPVPMDLDSASDFGPPKPTTPVASRPFRSSSLKLDQKGSGRPSLEVPGHRPRASLGGAASEFDSTAPNSPEPKAKKLSTYIPTLNMDLSSPPSRKHSPTRKPALQRVRSKINRLRDRSAEPELFDDYRPDGGVQITIPETPPRKVRSPSPSKKFQRHQKRLTTDIIDSPTVAALIAPRAKDDNNIRPIRSRNPLNRVGDMLWKRGRRGSSSSSEDEEETAVDIKESLAADHRKDSLGVSTTKTRSKSPLGKSFLDEMPDFKSPFSRSKERSRGRSPNPISENGLSPMGTRTTPPPRMLGQAAENGDLKEERERKERLRPPKIEIDHASGASTPALNSEIRMLLDHRGSTTTVATDRSSLSRVLSADSRLNQMLGVPGYSARERDFFLPVTGLAHIDHSRENRGEKRKAADEIKISRKEIARIRAILLSTGIKAKEIARRAEAIQSIDDDASKAVVPHITHQSEELARLPQREQFLAAGQMIESSVRAHHAVWQASVEGLVRNTVPQHLQRIDAIKEHLDGDHGLMKLGTDAADDADALGREIMGNQIQKVKALSEALDSMMRKRRRRFRWLRRGGWVLVEWALVGVMWWVWFVVVLLRVGRGFIGGIIGAVRWLLWL